MSNVNDIGRAEPLPATGSEKTNEEKKTKRRVHHISSRYMQGAPSSSAKKATPVNPIVTPNSAKEKQTPAARKNLFRNVPTPVRAPTVQKIQLKVRKSSVPVIAGPVVAVPTVVVATDETLNAAMEMELLVSQNVASQFLYLKTRDSLRKLSDDAPRKLWALKEVNRELISKRISYEVELYRSSILLLLGDHVSQQKDIQENLGSDLASYAEKATELADALDACLHYLPLRNCKVPENSGKLKQEVEKVSGCLDDAICKISACKTYLDCLSSEMIAASNYTSEQVETISRLQEALEEVQDVSNKLTFYLAKQMQSTVASSYEHLCSADI